MRNQNPGDMIRSAAKQGNFDLVETLLIKNKMEFGCKFFDFDEFANSSRNNSGQLGLANHTDIDYAGMGAAEGGYTDKAKEFLRRGANIALVISSATQADLFHLANELLKTGIGHQSVAIFIERVSQNRESLDHYSDNIESHFFGSIPHCSYVLGKAKLVLALTSKFNGLSHKEALSLVHPDNSTALIYMVSIATFANSKLQQKTGLDLETLNLIFSFVFGYNSNQCVSKKTGFGLFLSKINPRIVENSHAAQQSLS